MRVFGLAAACAGCGWAGCWICSILLAGLCYQLESDQASKPSVGCHSQLRGIFKWGESYWNSWVRVSDKALSWGRGLCCGSYCLSWEETKAASGTVPRVVEPSPHLTYPKQQCLGTCAFRAEGMSLC